MCIRNDCIFTGILLIFALAALWDAFTTVYGTYQILGMGEPQLVSSVIFALVIFGILIWTPVFLDAGTFIPFKVLWFLALLYDFYTSLIGNKAFVIQSELNTNQTIIIFGVALFITSTPVMLSYLLLQLYPNET